MDNMKLVHTSNIGDLVICDFCNKDGKLSKGGVMIGSHAVCGDCSEKNNYYSKDYKYNNEIDEVFDINKTFQQNVLDYRKKKTGSSDGICRILTW
tara:strand:- start:1271 stop:1555 length:285 start_codon:yes stop_codon:yes gene_type:complete